GDGGRDSGGIKQPSQPPNPRPAAIFEMSLGAEVANGRAIRDVVFAPVVVAAVFVPRVLRSFLVIQHQVDGDFHPARPSDEGRLRPVADEIARLIVQLGGFDHLHTFSLAMIQSLYSKKATLPAS